MDRMTKEYPIPCRCDKCMYFKQENKDDRWGMCKMFNAMVWKWEFCARGEDGDWYELY